jgi:hypothetical protein
VLFLEPQNHRDSRDHPVIMIVLAVKRCYRNSFESPHFLLFSLCSFLLTPSRVPPPQTHYPFISVLLFSSLSDSGYIFVSTLCSAPPGWSLLTVCTHSSLRPPTHEAATIQFFLAHSPPGAACCPKYPAVLNSRLYASS